MRRGFLYLVAVMDWWSRAALSWRLSNTMDAGFCVAALEEALRRYGRPEVFNTDQGSQFTCEAFVGTLLGAEIAVSMDGRGRWMDNVFIERLWRSLKHEEVYLKDYADVREARAGIGAWIEFYNALRHIRRWGTECRWRCGGLAWDRRWICRCAWTTLTRCPHIHSRRNNGTWFMLEREAREDGA